MTHDATHTRPDDARRALDAFVRDRMAMPFGWGVNDCCLFAADAVRAMTGRDLAAAERGTYSTASQALALVERLGGLEAIGDRAGARIAPLLAQPGDVGLVEVNGRQLLAVCAGPCWLAPTGAGLTAIDLQAAALAWRVDHG